MSGFPNPPVVPVTGTYATAATIVESTQVVGDTNPRFTIGADGKMSWGPGNGALDTDLYRSGVQGLKTDGQLAAASYLISRAGSADQVAIGNLGPSGQSAITFQNLEAGSNLYRSAAGQMTIDGNFVVGGQINGSAAIVGATQVIGGSGATIARLGISAAGVACFAGGGAAGGSGVGGTLSYGTGAPVNASGTNGDIYLRVDGGAGTTIYQRRAGAWVGIV